MRKILLLTICLLSYGCTHTPIERASLPENDSLVIAHRGASAYVAAHTIAAYDLAVQMNTDYIEIDLQMTKDGKLIAMHDKVVTFNGTQQEVANLSFNDLQNRYTLVTETPKFQSVYATPNTDDLRIVDMEEILANYGDSVNYYIELKSPDIYPGMEKKLLQQLREYHLLNREDKLPKVIIQSFDEDSLRNIFAIEPSIPLIKLYKFKNDASFTKKELRKLTEYASGVGVNAEAVTRQFIESTQSEGLHIHPYTVNDEETMRRLLQLGVNGFFTDRPDVALRIKNESNGNDID